MLKIDDDTQIQVDAFLNELKECVENRQITGDFSYLYDKYPKVKCGIRRAMFWVDKQIRKELRQAIYDSKLPFQNWDCFSFDESGTICTPDGQYQARKIDGKYQFERLNGQDVLGY